MKTGLVQPLRRPVSRLPLALALALVPLLSAGCDKIDAWRKGAQSAATGSAPGAAGVTGSAATGGGEAGAGGAPSQAGPSLTLDAYKDAVARKDYDKLFSLMSGQFQKKALAEVDRMKKVLVSGTEVEKKEVLDKLRKLGMTPEEYQKGEAEKLAARSLGQEVAANPGRFPTAIRDVKAIKIDGERATVTYSEDSGSTGTLKFMKETGSWRIGE
ncbi:MAG: hypothetical protein HYZ53_25125 [Planctomycetes bacterium]|nr:hypothetical protein [Planctomycetota bacterium]